MGAGPADLSRGALEVLANGGEVNYKGASTTLDWDEYGDLLRGHADVWRFSDVGRIEGVKVVPLGG